MKPNLLFYGDDPTGATGYARQARNILTRMAPYFNIAVIGINRADESPEAPFVDDRLPFKIYRADIEGKKHDEQGKELLQTVFPRMGAQVLFLMGDVWALSPWAGRWLESLQMQMPFKTVAYVSTEYPLTETDTHFLNVVDLPICHSKWGLGFQNGAGFEVVKAACPRAIYIPDTVDPAMFYPYSEERRQIDRANARLGGEQFVIMNVNRNTTRKDLPATIRAFARVKKEIPSAHLYLHTAPKDTWQSGSSPDLKAYALARGLRVPEDVSFPGNFTPHHGYPTDVLNRIYNCADVVVSTSVSEGFGVTPVEALFAECPVLIPGHSGFSQVCETVGIKPVDSYATIREEVAPCSVYAINEDDLVNRLIEVYEKKQSPAFKLETNRQAIAAVTTFSADRVFERDWKPVCEWLAQPQTKVQAILFAQHASAGDVLLSTSTLAGLKQRHPGLPLVYMTQAKYHDLVAEHPMIDRVIDWQPSMFQQFEPVYSPHTYRILRGNWGAGETPLAKLYAEVCGVQATKPQISLKKPDLELPSEYVVVHTTSHPYRNYYHFHEALAGCLLPVVQVGGADDTPLGIPMMTDRGLLVDMTKNQFTYLDLRGKLSYRETAYVISNAKGFVGIDSFPMHVAGLYDIPMVVTFGSGASRVTGAITNGPHAYINPEYARICPVLGPCSGNYQCANPCGPRHASSTVKKALLQVMPSLFPKPIDPEEVVMRLLRPRQELVSV